MFLIAVAKSENVQDSLMHFAWSDPVFAKYILQQLRKWEWPWIELSTEGHGRVQWKMISKINKRF